MNTRTARFWIFAREGWVRLTLRPGQSLTWGAAWNHEEGWSSEVHTWTLDAGVVTYRTDEDGRDCDGRSLRTCVLVCPVDKLRARRCDGDDRPDWNPIDVRTRDYSAEAAGY